MKSSETAPAPASDVEVFRRFNRMYTRFIGTLNETLLNSEFSLAEARVLFELANRNQSNANEIAEELGMDPGYLSRILSRFERDGLLRKKASKDDARYTELVLTASGKSAFKKLNALSGEQARAVLEGLATPGRAELIRSMQSVEAALAKTGRGSRPYVLRTHRIGDMGWVIHSEGVGYAQQFGWDASFEALVAKIVADFMADFNPARERCWIAEIDGQNVGHIFLVEHPTEADTAKLRLLYVDPCARGMGIGDALVDECIRFARSVGYRRVVLWTQSILKAAHRIYQRAGFRLIREEPHHSFGCDLIGQEWELDLKKI